MLIANIVAIFQKELQSYLKSPFAYIIAAIFWLVSGFFFGFILQEIVQGVAFQEQTRGMAAAIDVPSEFINVFFDFMSSLLLVLLPALSMGLYAEERKRGTLELLATSPLNNWVVALGKLLGVVTFFTILIVPLWLYQIIILSASQPPVKLPPILLANLGLVIVAMAILSLGMFISSLTESGILAYILTFVLILFLWILDAIAGNIGGVFGEILSHLSLFNYYQDLTR
ncbi:MAG: ABC transporter permease [Snowella sp.]